MELPIFKTESQRIEPKLLQFRGLNRNALISDDQFSVTSNASTKNFPILSPRPSRATQQTLVGTGHALTNSSAQLAWVDGTDFKYNNVTKGTVTASAKSIVDFNGRLIIFPDKKYYDYVADSFGTLQGSVHMTEYGFDTNGDVDYTRTDLIRNRDVIPVLPAQNLQLTNDKSYTVAKHFFYDVNMKLVSYSTVINFAAFTVPATVYYMNFDIEGTDLTVDVKITGAVYPTAGAIPDIDFAAVLNNRIWAVKDDDIYACAQGNANDWTTFQAPSVATDSWQVDTGTGGSFTGLVTYADSVYAFKKDMMWKLFGDVASNFQFVEITDLGCISGKTAVEANNVLYYLGRKGVYQFSGGYPQLISDDLNDVYSSGVAGTDDKYYYLSLYNGSSYKLYVYDTWRRVWMQEDTLQVKDFAYLDGYLYALAVDNIIYKFNSGSETVTMELTTKEFTDSLFQRKGASEINILADLETSTTLTVATRINNAASFTAVKTAYATADLNTLRIPISVNRANHFQIKLTMVGEGKIYGIERSLYIGGRI